MTMTPIGYIIYQFWDFKSGKGEYSEWETYTCQPHLHHNKKVYSELSSAEEAIEQMKKIDHHNTYYHILPIYTPEDEFIKIKEAYKQRVNK